jgi:hypothetical protein
LRFLLGLRRSSSCGRDCAEGAVGTQTRNPGIRIVSRDPGRGWFFCKDSAYCIHIFFPPPFSPVLGWFLQSKWHFFSFPPGSSFFSPPARASILTCTADGLQYASKGFHACMAVGP